MYPGSLLQLAGTVLRRLPTSGAGQFITCSVQSLGIGGGCTLLGGGGAGVYWRSLLGAIPFLGFLITILCWLLYIALLVVCVVVRVRLMLAAYAGIRFTLPLIGERLAVLFDKR